MRKYIFCLIIAFLALGELMSYGATAYWTFDKSSGSATYTLTTATSGQTNFIVNGTEYQAIGNTTLSGSANVTIVLNTSDPVCFRGKDETTTVCITVQKGATLTIKLGDNYSSAVNSFRRWSSYKGYFIRNNGGTVNITGKDGQHLIIDGMANMEVTGSDESGYTATNKVNEVLNKTVNADYALLFLACGTSSLKYVDLVNNFNCKAAGDQSSGSGGAIDAYYSTLDTPKNNLTLQNCKISRCYSSNSGVALYLSNRIAGSSVEMTDCIIEDNFTACEYPNNAGGTIRTFGISTASMKMKNCIMRGNKSNNYSGGILWNSSSKLLELDNCEFDHNWCKTDGGALQIMSQASLKACNIHDNYSKGSGGGISVKTFNSGSYQEGGYAPLNGTITLDSQTIISNNTAEQDGGGINFNVRRIVNNDQKLTSGKPRYSVYYNNEGKQYQISLVVNGSQIHHNKALKNGGGISINRITRIYESNLTVNSGNIYSNEAGEKGGAIYVNSNDSEDNDKNAAPVMNKEGTKTVSDINYTSLTATFGNTENLNVSDLRLCGNTATDGGAVYVDGNYHSTNIVNGLIGEETAQNIVTGGNGGAFYVNGGNLSIAKGTISYNKSIISGNSGGKGGAVYVSGGSLTIGVDPDENGGSSATTDLINANNNTATADGGAFYVNGGEVKVFASTLSSNHAVNGGAIYSNGGAFTFKNGIINYNIVTGNGAGLYSNGGAVSFTNGDIAHNEASLNGGGGYVAGGTVSFDGNLKYNTARNGGGLCLSSGCIMTFVGGIITGNNAKISGTEPASHSACFEVSDKDKIEGFGGGIYMEKNTESDPTTLQFQFKAGYNTFGLYSNTAATAGDELAAQGKGTSIILPPMSKMSLIGFEGQDANPFWYQDYNEEDNYYNNVPGNTIYHAVTEVVSVLDRYRELVKADGKDFIQHRIDDTRLPDIYNHYLCLTLGFSMLDLKITAKGLLGGETALVNVIRQGNTISTYKIILSKTNDELTTASKTLANLPWGTYTIEPDNAWNWAYEPIAPMENIRLGDNPQHEIVLEMHHNSVSMQPLHYDVHNINGTGDGLNVTGGFYNGSTDL